MSTRSNIGILNTDGTIDFIYCHFDGYVEGVGAILHEHYLDESKVRELIALGDISSLDVRVQPRGKGHSFSDREAGTTTAYGRDRGEPWENIQPCKTEPFEKPVAMHKQEYAYLFLLPTRSRVDGVGDRRWIFCAHDSIWHPLDEAL